MVWDAMLSVTYIYFNMVLEKQQTSDKQREIFSVEIAKLSNKSRSVMFYQKHINQVWGQLALKNTRPIIAFHVSKKYNNNNITI